MTEHTVGGLVVRIDRLLCVGFGDCIEAAPGFFEFDGEGIVAFREHGGEVEREQLLAACDSCPVDALSVHDEAGRQLVP